VLCDWGNGQLNMTVRPCLIPGARSPGSANWKNRLFSRRIYGLL